MSNEVTNNVLSLVSYLLIPKVYYLEPAECAFHISRNGVMSILHMGFNGGTHILHIT